jgi:hypothetical protein
MPDTSVSGTWTWKKPSFWVFFQSLMRDTIEVGRKRPILVSTTIATVVLFVYSTRQTWQPYVLLLPRKYALGILLAVGIAFLGWLAISWILPKGLARFLRPLGAVLGLVLAMLGAVYGQSVHTYFAQYWRYETLETVEPDMYPTTGHERIWPLHGVYTYARQQMNETEAPSRPNLVRIGTGYYWTLGVEPSTPILQYTDPVEEVVRIPATVTGFDLQRRKNAHFETGEGFWFSRNIYTCVRRSMWFWEAATYEPADNVIYLTDDTGAQVQVVPMILWKGWAFPRPEFGGVIIIKEDGPHPLYRKWLWDAPKRALLGCGTWISPESIKDHAYLRGQNIVPYEVTRYMAASTRFRAGLEAPMPWRKEGDIRIADLPEDVNQQPFTMFFNIRMKGKVVDSKLFHYYALEPEAADKQGLATSFLAPADGIGPSYVYWHFGSGASCIGVTAVGSWVRASKRNYDWTVNVPVEHRPYLRDIPDENGSVRTRWMWFTTIVTIDKSRVSKTDPDGYVTGTPEIAITDCHHPSETVWVNRRRPEQWPDELREALGHVWATQKQ